MDRGGSASSYPNPDIMGHDAAVSTKPMIYDLRAVVLG